jgi:hypothetical protein
MRKDFGVAALRGPKGGLVEADVVTVTAALTHPAAPGANRPEPSSDVAHQK